MEQQIFTTFSGEEFKSQLRQIIKEELKNASPANQSKANELLKIKEIANLLHVSEVTIHTWKKNGLIPYRRIANKIFFEKSEVIEALDKVNFSKAKTLRM